MSAAIEKMGYFGAKPWHDFGNEVVDEAAMYDTQKFMVACGQDWECEKRQLARNINGEWKLAEAWEIVRLSDQKVLANMIGERYTILQNRDAFGWFQPFLDAKEAIMHTGGSLFGGARIWALAKLNRDPMEIAAGDIVEKYVLLSHSHDGSLSVRVGFSPIRVVCSNTLAMAHSDKASKLIRIKHSKNVHQNLENIRETMNLANAEFEATAEQYRLLASKSINQNDLRKYIKMVFKIDADDSVIWPEGNQKRDKEIVSERQKHILEEVFSLVETGPGNNLPSIKGTWWQAYQGVNAYLNYGVSRNADNRMNSLWFGQNANMNNDALALAVQLAV